MIVDSGLLTPSDSKNPTVLSPPSPSLSARSLTAPPIHPSIQYGGSEATPPGYHIARRPAIPITYTFWPQVVPPNAMILAPPAGVITPQPSYYILVNLNCFTPSSYITTIKRGSWDGDFVGDFEMGLPNSKKPPTVCIRNNECLITQALDSKILAFRNAWTWKISDPKKQTLYWDEGVNTLSCFSSKSRTSDNLLAKLMTPVHLRRQGRATELTRLEVSPQGHEFFDDILLSALIIERIRTTSS